MKRFAAMVLALVLAFSPIAARAETFGGRTYNNLPALMTMESGSPVATAEDFSARRSELLGLFADTMYRAIPTEGFETAFEVIEQGETLNDSALRKQIKITVTTEKGSSDALMLLVLPKSSQPVPVAFGLSFSSIHTALADPAIQPSYGINKYPRIDEATRGAAADSWCIEEAVERGYGIGIVFCDDFMPDNTRTYAKRVISVFDKPR